MARLHVLPEITQTGCKSIDFIAYMQICRDFCVIFPVKPVFHAVNRSFSGKRRRASSINICHISFVNGSDGFRDLIFL